jgi:hypothetical protein
MPSVSPHGPGAEGAPRGRAWWHAVAEGALEKRGIHPPDDLRPLALGVPHPWLLTSARYFQTLGFYTEYLDLSDAALPGAEREAVRWR